MKGERNAVGVCGFLGYSFVVLLFFYSSFINSISRLIIRIVKRYTLLYFKTKSVFVLYKIIKCHFW
jgi:hypothetical protein